MDKVDYNGPLCFRNSESQNGHKSENALKVFNLEISNARKFFVNFHDI